VSAAAGEEAALLAKLQAKNQDSTGSGLPFERDKLTTACSLQLILYLHVTGGGAEEGGLTEAERIQLTYLEARAASEKKRKEWEAQQGEVRLICLSVCLTV
jgi:hypothetical protein